MRLGRFVAVALAATLIVLLCAAPAFAGKMPTNNIPYDVSYMLKGAKGPKQLAPAEAKAAILAQGDPYLHDNRPPDLTLTLYDWDPAHAGPHVVPFWKEYVGVHSDVYVGWNDLTPPPTSSQQDHTITSSQITSMGVEFDQRIWASDVFHFGNYLPRVPKSLTASEAANYDGKRAAIMVYNIRDEAYWSSYRFYIAGYFWGGLNDELGINAIFVDSYDWANRTGPTSARPRLYEGTIAHEFEHLIHNDVDGDEDSFIDEGMADLAEQFIYGTQTTDSHIGEYLYYHRDSLTDWKGELFDYGNSVLWQDYLWENAGGAKLSSGEDPLAGRVADKHDPFEDSDAKFVDPGDAFTWNLIHDQDNGLTGVANRYKGGMDTVEQLHRDYTLANLLDGKVKQPEWNYRNLALGGADSAFMTVDQGIAFYSSRVRGNMPPTRKNVRRRTIAEAWGAYYRTFTGSEPGFTMTFKGSPKDGVLPYSPPTEWYAGLGNGLQRTLSRTIASVPESATLEFQTWFDIEEDWDYGYVEASTDGKTWTQLPQISALRAGDTNKNGSSAWGGPGGFTGNSGGWKLAAFSLKGFSGDVQVRFRYATDEASNGQGWYVDDIKVGDVFSDPVDSENGWETNGWLFTTGLQNNDWTVDAFVPFMKGRRLSYEVKPIVPVSGIGTEGSVYVPAQFLKNSKTYGIVANRPRDGVFDATGFLTIAKGK